MVVKIMRWRPWPPPFSKKFRVNLTVLRLESKDWGNEDLSGGLVVDIKWKGPKVAFRRNVRRNYTREEVLRRADDDGSNGGVLVEWDEEFHSVSSLSGYKENAFQPWEIQFSVLHMLNQGAKNTVAVIGVARLDLAKYVTKMDEQTAEVKLPLTVPNMAGESSHVLNISLSLLEVVAAQELNEAMQSPTPTLPLPSPAAPGETEKDEVSALKARLRKVKIFTEYVSKRKAKKACREGESAEGRSPAKSEEVEFSSPFDSDSAEEFEDGESDEVKGESDVRMSFSYGTLAFANYAGVSSYSNSGGNDGEDWVYYSNRCRSDACHSHVEDTGSAAVPGELLIPSSKRSILPWRKRKLSFRSPKAKGEPLLKKEAYGEEGGDDIDFDRRQLSPDASLASLLFGWRKTDEDSNVNSLSVSEFGDDSFAVGTWERKEITCRDGLMKIETEVFFASIDQRNEKAAGESACTALVAVIADWLQHNPNLMPIKSQFDSLIRDGSLEWRNLCEKDTYKECFPDKHFDLETVLQAQIRDLRVVPDKSFIGFFHPDNMELGNFEFLHGAMSFDDIWDEITRSKSSGHAQEAPVFIVSWNDHFFVLKVEPEAYYIIDTLGERLHEGCNQAYILKFDQNTTIYKLPNTSPSFEEKSTKGSNESEVVCQGKESCKEYIKSFLAAIPIRELQADIKKGLPMSSMPLHHRLQIEFHFTKPHQQAPASPTTEPTVGLPEVVDDDTNPKAILPETAGKVYI